MPVSLTPKTVDLAGEVAALVAASDATGFSFANDGKTILHIKNANTQTISVSVTSLKKCSQNQLHSVGMSLTQNQEAFIGPFAIDEFNDTVGIVTAALTLNGGAAASITAEVLKIPDYGR